MGSWSKTAISCRTISGKVSMLMSPLTLRGDMKCSINSMCRWACSKFLQLNVSYHQELWSILTALPLFISFHRTTVWNQSERWWPNLGMQSFMYYAQSCAENITTFRFGKMCRGVVFPYILIFSFEYLLCYHVLDYWVHQMTLGR